MSLLTLKLKHIRNYTEENLEFDPEGITAFIGDNAQGKTNLLESVAFLALGKSFRAVKALDVLQWGESKGSIQGTILKEDRRLSLELILSKNPQQKIFKKRGKTCSPSEFLGHLQIVLFTPDTLHIVHGSPSLRRQVLDRLLIQLDFAYFEAWTKFQRLLKHRNALLKQIQMEQAFESDLDPWEVQMAEVAELIWHKRRNLCENFIEKLPLHYQTLASASDALELQYLPDKSEESFLTILQKTRREDLIRGNTQRGPHRDDFRFRLNGRALEEIGSRGECRSAVLALKMAEIEFLKNQTGQKPLLLLDDVFSELDETRQTHLGTLISGHQVLLTTTSLEHVRSLPNLQLWEVQGGRAQKTN